MSRFTCKRGRLPKRPESKAEGEWDGEIQILRSIGNAASHNVKGMNENLCKADAKKHNGARKKRDLALDAKTLSDGSNFLRSKPPFSVNDSHLSVSTSHACGQHGCHAKRVHPVVILFTRCLLRKTWLPLMKEKLFSLLMASRTLSTLASMIT